MAATFPGKHLESPPRFIAITGPQASGKDLYAGILETRGYMHVSAGDFMRAEARARGYKDPIPRAVLSQVGDSLKAQYGPSPVTSRTLERYEREQAAYPAGIVISGLRRVGELKAFKEHGAVAVWVDVDPMLGFQREQSRSRGDVPESYKEFLEKSHVEYYGAPGAGPEAVRLEGIEALADFKFTNNGTKEAFVQALDSILGFGTSGN